jgi:hypothetical protein
VPETLTERLVAIAALLVAVALIALSFAGREGHRTVQVATPAAGPAATGGGPSPTLADAPVVPLVVEDRAATRGSSTSADAAKVVVTAARGSCWVSIRVGSADGEVLFEGILDSGRTVRLTRSRIWIRLGAAANVDVSVNGKRARGLPGGTVDLLATRTGIAPQSG